MAKNDLLDLKNMMVDELVIIFEDVILRAGEEGFEALLEIYPTEGVRRAMAEAAANVAIAFERGYRMERDADSG